MLSSFLPGTFRAALLGCLVAACGPQPGPVSSGWPMHVVDDSLEGADGVDLFDVDADGDLDAVVGWEESRALRLYLNPGGSGAAAPWLGTDIAGGVHVGKIEDAGFGDLDGDGRLDAVFTASEKGSEQIAVHWLADSARPDLPASWHGKEITSSLRYRYIKLALGDIDGDGQADVVAGAKGDGKPGALVWMRSPPGVASENTSLWDAQLIDELEWVDSLLLVDLDGDGWRDVLVNHNHFIGWYRNPSASGGAWQRQLISDATGPYFARCPGPEQPLRLVAGADLSAHEAGDPVLYLVERAAVAADAWRVEPITSRAAVPRNEGSADYQVKGLACGALDDNPLPDVAVAISGHGAGVFALMNLELDSATAPQLVPIATTERNSYKGVKYDDLRMVDVDGDGDLDLVTTEENGRDPGMLGYWRPRGLGVIWYENPQFSPSRCTDRPPTAGAGQTSGSCLNR